MLNRLRDFYLAFSFYPQKEENIQGSQVKPTEVLDETDGGSQVDPKLVFSETDWGSLVKPMGVRR
jgi:hypothetical protein